jgi:hypothetical protein
MIVLKAGKRLAIAETSLDNWYGSYSPRNNNDCAEGQWCQWVHLARQILADDRTKKFMPDFHVAYDDPHLYDECHPSCGGKCREDETE